MNILDICQEVDTRQELTELRELLFEPILRGEFTAESLWKATRYAIAVAALEMAEEELPENLLIRLQQAKVREALWLTPREPRSIKLFFEPELIEESKRPPPAPESRLQQLAELPGDLNHVAASRRGSLESRWFHNLSALWNGGATLSTSQRRYLLSIVLQYLKLNYPLKWLPDGFLGALSPDERSQLSRAMLDKCARCDGYSLCTMANYVDEAQAGELLAAVAQKEGLSFRDLSPLAAPMVPISSELEEKLFRTSLLGFESIYQQESKSLFDELPTLLSTPEGRQVFEEAVRSLPTTGLMELVYWHEKIGHGECLDTCLQELQKAERSGVQLAGLLFLQDYMSSEQLLELLTDIEGGPRPDVAVPFHTPHHLESCYKKLHQNLLKAGEKQEARVRALCHRDLTGEYNYEKTEGLPFFDSLGQQEERLWLSLLNWTYSEEGSGSDRFCFDSPAHELYSFQKELGGAALAQAVDKLKVLEEQQAWTPLQTLSIWQPYILEPTLRHHPRVAKLLEELPSTLRLFEPESDDGPGFDLVASEFASVLSPEVRKEFLEQAKEIDCYEDDFYEGLDSQFLQQHYSRWTPQDVCEINALVILLGKLPLEVIKQELQKVVAGDLALPISMLRELFERAGMRREYLQPAWENVKCPEGAPLPEGHWQSHIFRNSLWAIYGSTSGATRAILARLLWSQALLRRNR